MQQSTKHQPKQPKRQHQPTPLPDSHKRNVKIAIISAIVLFAATILLAVFLFIQDTKRTASLEITIAPSFAQVEIDHKTYRTNGVERLKPGHYTAHISADGFTSQDVELELIGGKTSQLMLYLFPSDGSMDWYREHSSEMMILNTIGDAQAAANAQNYHDLYPISKDLPIIVVEVDPTTYAWTEYRIDGGTFAECKNQDFCLKITDSTGGNESAAYAKIREKGYNPNDYEIIYEYVPVEPLN